MARLNREAVAALKHPDTKERLVALGAEPAPSTPQQADAYFRSEVERWTRILTCCRSYARTIICRISSRFASEQATARCECQWN